MGLPKPRAAARAVDPGVRLIDYKMMSSTLLAILGQLAFAAGPADAPIAINNPKAPVKDSLVVTITIAGKSKKHVWPPKATDMDTEKSGTLVWHEAFVMPDRKAFLLIKHVSQYEDDSIFPSIRLVSGKSIVIQTDGIPASNGIHIYLSKDGQCLHFRGPETYDTADRIKNTGIQHTNLWARQCYDTKTGKLIEKESSSVSADISNYIRLDEQK